ncbi:hypothetical protein POX_d05772 [Penicillium oxalicum]|uniref:hypothetical protein n=1 Tax=Penicillium oxalicum TaxID=69781 RepID=UPI0020B8E6AF|nr:hypothetical protein POX_d05772 [Penicillium oxalicum]KAI2790263.1 hypothetical protein POX_d05772 [Penicillium oxalicum]
MWKRWIRWGEKGRGKKSKMGHRPWAILCRERRASPGQDRLFAWERVPERSARGQPIPAHHAGFV